MGHGQEEGESIKRLGGWIREQRHLFYADLMGRHKIELLAAARFEFGRKPGAGLPDRRLPQCFWASSEMSRGRGQEGEAVPATDIFLAMNALTVASFPLPLAIEHLRGGGDALLKPEGGIGLGIATAVEEDGNDGSSQLQDSDGLGDGGWEGIPWERTFLMEKGLSKKRKYMGGVHMMDSESDDATDISISAVLANIRITYRQKFEDLLCFKQAHGHCNVPQKHTDNPKLGTWVMNQRWCFVLI